MRRGTNIVRVSRGESKTQKPPNSTTVTRIAIVFEAGILVLALLLGMLLGTPPLRRLHVTYSGAAVGCIATAPLLLGMWMCLRSNSRPLQELMRQVRELIVPMFRGASTISLLVVSVLAGLGEELLFRGVLQFGLSHWVGMPVALAVTSVLFGLAHLITPTYAVAAGIIGAYLGGLVVLTGNLLVPVLAHALYDFVALKYLVGLPDLREEAATRP